MCGKVVLLDLLADEADQSRPKASLSWFGGKVWYRRYCKFKLFPCFVQMDCVQRWKARNSILKQRWLVPLLQSRAQFWAATWWGRREATKTHLEVQQGAKIKIQWEGLQSVLLTHHSNGNLLCCLMFCLCDVTNSDKGCLGCKLSCHLFKRSTRMTMALFPGKTPSLKSLNGCNTKLEEVGSDL